MKNDNRNLTMTKLTETGQLIFAITSNYNFSYEG